MTKPQTPPPTDQWRDYKPGFEVNERGQMRTKDYQPPPKPEPATEWPAVDAFTAAGVWRGVTITVVGEPSEAVARIVLDTLARHHKGQP